jgi:hypothetical protein
MYIRGPGKGVAWLSKSVVRGRQLQGLVALRKRTECVSGLLWLCKPEC